MGYYELIKLGINDKLKQMKQNLIREQTVKFRKRDTKFMSCMIQRMAIANEIYDMVEMFEKEIEEARNNIKKFNEI